MNDGDELDDGGVGGMKEQRATQSTKPQNSITKNIIIPTNY